MDLGLYLENKDKRLGEEVFRIEYYKDKKFEDKIMIKDVYYGKNINNECNCLIALIKKDFIERNK